MRLADWQLRFSDVVKQSLDKNFAWGSHDCCMWAANCTQAITGVDFAEKWRGSYADESSAYTLISSNGGLEVMTTTALGFAPVSTNFANVGDVVLLDMLGNASLGICNGSTILIPASNRMAILPISKALKIWKI